MANNKGVAVTVGAALSEVLARAGVKIAFTVPSESLLGLLDALNAGKIRIVSARHEGAASFMAEAAAQLTGMPVLALAGRAPGAANLSIGLHAARADSAPVIAIVGQVRREMRGREAFQEMDLARIFEPVVKWSGEVLQPADIVEMGKLAIANSTEGRPGPVLLSVPEDLLDLELPVINERNPVCRAERSVSNPDPIVVKKVLQLLCGSERPLILAGAGVLRSRGTEALVRFAETLQLPVISSWRRGDVFPNDHPLYMGMTGLGAPATVKARFAEADGLLVLGCRMNEITTYGYTLPAKSTRWVHLDLEPRISHPEHAPEIAVAGDVTAFLREAQRIAGGDLISTERLEARRLRNAECRKAYEISTTVSREPWKGPGIHPGRVVSTLGRVLPHDAILTTDAGDFGTWAARGCRFRRPGTFLGTTSGAMGFGLPAAIGAALARPGSLAVALAGDGGFAMTMAELETAVRENARVMALVFDNNRYGTIWRHQNRRNGHVGLATGLGPVDFAAVAGACGALGLSVQSDDEFEPALRQALDAARPAVIHLAMDPHWTTPDAFLA